MKLCFFCNITDGYNKNKELFFARFDDYPVSPGHCLIISRKHITSFFTFSEEEINELYQLMVEVKNKLKQEFQPHGFNIGFNEGKAAGQTLDHFHLHIIPRYEGDVADPRGGIRRIFPDKADYTKVVPKRVTE